MGTAGAKALSSELEMALACCATATNSMAAAVAALPDLTAQTSFIPVLPIGNSRLSKSKICAARLQIIGPKTVERYRALAIVHAGKDL